MVVPARHDGPQREAGDRRRLTGPDRTTDQPGTRLRYIPRVPEIESIAAGGLDATVLQWVAGVLACGEVTVLRGMREGGSPWLLRAGDRAVVLRVGGPDDAPGLAT